MSMVTAGLAMYRSIKLVHAGEIIEVKPEGCMVEAEDGTAAYRAYAPNMTVRYTPVVGDFWIVYDSSYQSISPRDVFLSGYILEKNHDPTI